MIFFKDIWSHPVRVTRLCASNRADLEPQEDIALILKEKNCSLAEVEKKLYVSIENCPLHKPGFF